MIPQSSDQQNKQLMAIVNAKQSYATLINGQTARSKSRWEWVCRASKVKLNAFLISLLNQFEIWLDIWIEPLWQTAIGLRGPAKPLDDYNMISLPAPDGRGETRAKRANQESKERPQQ